MFFLLFAVAMVWLLWDMVCNWRQTCKYEDLSEELQEQAQEDGTNRTDRLRIVAPDVVGYITIPDTPIDYPVMQSEKEDGQYYLWRDAYGNKDRYGTPFLDIRCDMDKPSRNLIIYGHNMINKTMFGCLRDYRKRDFWVKHQEVILERGNVTEYYQVAAVLDMDVGQEEDKDFFWFVDPSDEKETRKYLKEIKDKELYDTKVSITTDDYLLTLVTCYRYKVGENGRTVIIAKRKS
jgi:sortase B